MSEKSAVDSYMMPLDAELAKAYLESFGIRVSLKGDVVAGAAFALGPMLGGISLFVEPKDAERAAELLKDYHAALRVPGVQTYESADALAKRALRTALLGLILFPVVLHIGAIVMLSKVRIRALSTKGRRHFVVAWLISGLVIVVAASYLVRQLS